MSAFKGRRTTRYEPLANAIPGSTTLWDAFAHFLEPLDILLSPCSLLIVLRSFKYRLRSTNRQEAVLDAWLGQTRELYNAALQERRDAWRNQRVSVSRVDQEKQITEVREARPEFQAIPLVVLRGALRRLDKSFQSFFRRCKEGNTPGFPRFKGRGWWKTLEIDDLGRKDGVPLNPVLAGKRRVKVPLLGTVKLNLHRPLEGVPKVMRLTRDGRGRWFVVLACEDVPAKPLPPCSEEVGVDLGLLHLATTSDGVVYDNPRPLAQARLRVERLQRTVSRRKKGGGRRRQAVRQLRRCHERVANVRREHHIRVARDLVSKYGTVYIEDLNVKGLSRSRLSKSVHDAAWAGQLHWLRVQAESAERTVVEVDPAYTSKTCSSCGHVKETLSLSERTFVCPTCGHAIDRDVNAAINIKRLGQSLRGAATPVGVRRRSAKHESRRVTAAQRRAGAPE